MNRYTLIWFWRNTVVPEAKGILWLVIIFSAFACLTAQAQEPEHPDYQEVVRGQEYYEAFWQLTLINRNGLTDIGPKNGFDFMSRHKCVREGVKRMQISLETTFPPESGVWLGFVCELTKRKD